MARRLVVSIEGAFTEGELTALTTLMRLMDRDERHWNIYISDAQGQTLEEAKAMLQRVMIDIPGRETGPFSLHRRQ